MFFSKLAKIFWAAHFKKKKKRMKWLGGGRVGGREGGI